jgi:hypothetical protein
VLRSGSWRRLVLSAVVAATAVHGETRPDVLHLPDPATGAINGRVALLYWPVLATDDSKEPKLLPRAGCRVHLIPQEDPAAEHRYACGTWFQPPVGSYNAWLETADRISDPWTVIYGGAPSKGGLAAVVPVHPAGHVGTPAGRSPANGEELRILSLDSHGTRNGGRIFERRVRQEEAGNPVLMPAGRLVVGRFDRKSGDAVALSRPTSLQAGGAVRIWPEPPADGADLLVVLRKPSRTGEAAGTMLSVDDGERRRDADICIDGNRIIAIWYGIDARTVTVSFRAEKLTWPQREVRLAHRRVSTIRDRAERLPKLGVSITAPDDATLPDTLTVTVARVADERPVATGSIAPGAPRQFEDLPAELHRVTLGVGDWRFFKDVDLSTGDGEVVFDLEPITIAGTVFLGKEPAAAELRFHNHGNWVSVRTDDAGSYRATLWHAGYYSIRIAVNGSPRAPFTQHFTPIDESGTRDFHIPPTSYVLRVHDADTGAPVEGAKVNVGNVWRDDADVEQSLLDSTVTDDSGSTALPPLRAGRLLLTVAAKGYAEGRLEHAIVPDDRVPHELTMALHPVRRSARLRLLLPNGGPLAGAEIWAFADDHLGMPVWQATTSAEGLIDVPDGGAYVLIRHSDTASVARKWESGTGEMVEWRMDPPAPPLTASITRPGGRHARSARIALWLDGIRLSGAPLAFMTWSSPAADMRGSWTARNLPRKPARFLAIPLGSSTDIEARTFDGMSATVRFPWAVPVPVTTIE